MTMPPPRAILLVSARPDALREWGQRDPSVAWLEARPQDSHFLEDFANSRALVLESNGLDLSELHKIRHALENKPAFPVLLVLGDRGLAGAESLAWCKQVRVLPKPFTEDAAGNALHHLAWVSAKENENLFDPSFFAGLVEGLRDPLASISGYLQMLLEPGAASPEDLIPPALQATRESEQLLQALLCASQPQRLKIALCQSGPLAKQAIQQAEQVGRLVQCEDIPEGEFETDSKLLNLALFTGLLLLSRFGPEGDPKFFLSFQKKSCHLGWFLESKREPGLQSAPPFLATVFQLLAKQLQAEVSGDPHAPQELGLILPITLT